MGPVIIISSISVIAMLFIIIKSPKVTIKNHEFSIFWLAPTIGALLLIIFGYLPIDTAWRGLTATTDVNPLKILLLFFSMTFLSIVLDELGFFEYLASKVLKRAKTSQFRLFVTLYLLTAALTIFTSNDIIILTFTPFIVFFAKRANINPIPYLVAEFVSANTWSMFLIIGNPTNIYLATANQIDFLAYLKVMVLPTCLAGAGAFGCLFLIFKRELQKPLAIEDHKIQLGNEFLLDTDLVCLSLCTVILAVSSYLHLAMYIVALSFAGFVGLIIVFYSFSKRDTSLIKSTLKRLPWSLLPFVLSMFVIVLALKEKGVTEMLGSVLTNRHPIITYGFASTLTSNLCNNIPMSVLFTEIINTGSLAQVYATIIGSNIGAFVSPIGALAGIMWLTILKKHDIDYSFFQFLKYGVIIAIPTLILALIGLSIIL